MVRFAGLSALMALALLAAASDSSSPSDTTFAFGPRTVAASPALEGYRLPWPGGARATVTQREGAWHRSQVDFAIWRDGDGSSADLLAAAKDGIVYFVKASSPDPPGGCFSIACWRKANAVVIQHGADEYSWYVHLAYKSVPSDIQPGVRVERGTVIGRQGMTGWASGVHLHFMVSLDPPESTDPSDPNDLSWPSAIMPVDFLEAAWSDLRPGTTFISQNYPEAAG